MCYSAHLIFKKICIIHIFTMSTRIYLLIFGNKIRLNSLKFLSTNIETIFIISKIDFNSVLFSLFFQPSVFSVISRERFYSFKNYLFSSSNSCIVNFEEYIFILSLQYFLIYSPDTPVKKIWYGFLKNHS